MRWKTSHHGHDPRLNDLLAILALLVLIVGAWQYFGTHSEPPSKAALIVPSQSVRWCSQASNARTARNPVAAATLCTPAACAEVAPGVRRPMLRGR